MIQIVDDSSKTQTGWIEARYLKQNIPDPQAIFIKRKHEVKQGETLEKLLMKEYGASYDLKVGDDLRTIAEAFANLNKDNPGVYYTGEGGSWRDMLDPSMANARKVYQTIKIKHGYTIKLPSVEYINDLKKTGQVSQRSDIHNLAIEFGKGSTGFLLGFNYGLLKGAYDTVTGLVKLIYQLFTGELYAMFKKLFSMSWEQVKELFGAILGNFEKKWNHPNPYDRWFFRGEVLGQVVFEIALAVLSAGGGVVKNLSRIEKLVPILEKFDNLKKIITTAVKSKLGKVEKAQIEQKGIIDFIFGFFRKKRKKVPLSAKFDEISDFRTRESLPQYVQGDGSTGTIAKLEVGNKDVYGANSGLTQVYTLSKAERRQWFDLLKNKGKLKDKNGKDLPHLGHAQFLSHAEAEALVKAFKANKKLPKEMKMYVDRPTCPNCKRYLGALMTELKVQKLSIYWKNATQSPYVITAN